MTKEEANVVPIKLALETSEVNTIIACLGEHPFKEVHLLIEKIRNQAVAQFDAFVALTATPEQ